MQINFIGVGVLVLGAAIGFLSDAEAEALLKKETTERAGQHEENTERKRRLSLLIKGAGFVIAVFGVLLSMEII